MAVPRRKRTVRLTERQMDLADMLVERLGEASFNDLVVHLLTSAAAVEAYEEEQRRLWKRMYAHMEQRSNPRRSAAKAPQGGRRISQPTVETVPRAELIEHSTPAQPDDQLASVATEENVSDDVDDEEWRRFAAF